MNLRELQQISNDYEEFFIYSDKGVKYKSRWYSARAGLFQILECDGRVVKKPNIIYDVAGAPRARAERAHQT